MDFEVSLRDAIFLSLITGKGLAIAEGLNPRATIQALMKVADIAAEELEGGSGFPPLLPDDPS